MITLLRQGIIDIKDLNKDRKWAFYVILLISLTLIFLSVNRVTIYMSDFNMFIDPAVDAKFFDKDPITTWTNNAYSPFFYSVMSVFSIFSRWFAVILWSLISLAGIIISIQIIRHFLGKALSIQIYLWALGISLFSLVDNFQLGQCNVFLLALMLGALYYDSIGKPVKASIILGFAIAYKLIPLLLLFYFLLKRRYKISYLSITFGICLTVIVPFFFYSFDKGFLYIQTWFNGVLKPFFMGNDMQVSTASFYFTNQSLDAFLGRYLTSFGNEKYNFDLLWVLPLQTVKIIALSIKVIYLLGMAYLIKVKTKEEFSVYVLLIYGILLLSPVAWISYYIFLLPLIFIMIINWHNLYLVVKALFILGCILLLIDVNRAVQMYSLHFIGGLLLFITTYFTVLKKDNPLRNREIIV